VPARVAVASATAAARATKDPSAAAPASAAAASAAAAAAVAGLVDGYDAVVCARCGPAQKAAMVRLVGRRRHGGGGGGGEADSRRGGRVTLAVGDGGNDVPMLLAADVGVGICGNEGLQVRGPERRAVPRRPRAVPRRLGLRGR
jgi:hypothetical protein